MGMISFYSKNMDEAKTLISFNIKVNTAFFSETIYIYLPYY